MGMDKWEQPMAEQKITEQLTRVNNLSAAKCWEVHWCLLQRECINILLMKTWPIPILDVRYFQWLWHNSFWACSRFLWYSSIAITCSKINACCSCVSYLWLYRAADHWPEWLPVLWSAVNAKKLLLGAKRTICQDKTELWTFRNSVCLAAWVDAEFHYPFKLLQICSKELSLVGRATRQEPARCCLTMTLTAFGAAETTAPAKQRCLPASEIHVLEYSFRHLPTVIHPLLPPLQVKLWFSILNKTTKPACQSGSSLVSLFPPPQDSTCSRAAAQGLERRSRVRLVTAWHWLLFQKLLGSGLLRESSWCSPGLAKLFRLALPRSTFQHVLGFVTQTDPYQGSLLHFRSRSLEICCYQCVFVFIFFSCNIIVFCFCQVTVTVK